MCSSFLFQYGVNSSLTGLIKSLILPTDILFTSLPCCLMYMMYTKHFENNDLNQYNLLYISLWFHSLLDLNIRVNVTLLSVGHNETCKYIKQTVLLFPFLFESHSISIKCNISVYIVIDNMLQYMVSNSFRDIFYNDISF